MRHLKYSKAMELFGRTLDLIGLGAGDPYPQTMPAIMSLTD